MCSWPRPGSTTSATRRRLLGAGFTLWMGLNTYGKGARIAWLAWSRTMVVRRRRLI